MNQKWKCELGFHEWSGWQVKGVKVSLTDPGWGKLQGKEAEMTIQLRQCERCKKVQRENL